MCRHALHYTTAGRMNGNSLNHTWCGTCAQFGHELELVSRNEAQLLCVVLIIVIGPGRIVPGHRPRVVVGT
eukprot:scaffold650_cov407-Prasinococcus_capsulatus_cf.AAC.32